MPGIAELPTLSTREGIVYAVIETPRGSRAKFKYEPELGLFTLHKALSLGFSYPYAFGFIANTKAEDGDPLDVLLVTTLDTPTGCIVEARLIGVIEIEQRDDGHGPIVRNDRLIAVPALEHDDRQPQTLEAMPSREVDDIEAFFIASAERDGKEVKIIGRRGAEHALELVGKAQIKPEEAGQVAAEIDMIKGKIAKTAAKAGPKSDEPEPQR
jgi:inorganic pyrophosphatase